MSRVLIVDDDPDIQELLTDTLAHYGYEATAVSDVDSALERLTQAQFSAILLDLSLKGKSGHALIRATAQNPKRPPVIMLSGTSEKEDVAEAFRSGAKDFIFKPFSQKDLIATLRSVIENDQQAAALAAPGEGDSLISLPGKQPKPLGKSSGFVERLKSELKSGTISLPVPEQVISRLTDTVHLRDIELHDLVEMLSKIPQIAARILHLASTPNYSNRGGRVSTLPEAIQRIGTKATLNLASTMVTQKALIVVKGQFEQPAWKAWENTLLTATLARMIAKRVSGVANPDAAYLLGLFHNIGELLIMRLGYELEKKGEQAVPLEVVVHEINAHHCELGYFLCQAWRLNDLICKVAMHHHDRTMYNSSTDGALRKHCALTVLANHLALDLTGPYLPEHTSFPASSVCREILGLSTIDCITLTETARGSLGTLTEILSD